MRVLLTGMTSFTGRHLMPLLNEAGWEVFSLVRFVSGHKNEILWDFKGALPTTLPVCDAVVHLAAEINFSKDLDIDLYRTNTLATAKLVNYAKEHQAHFIFASSIAVHAPSERISIDTPIAPSSAYGASKYLAEEVIKVFLNNYSILRITGIYGFNGPEHLGLNKTMTQAAVEQKSPTLQGQGTAKRNYICVSDVAKWIVYLLQTYKTTRQASSNIYYLADPEFHSIRDYLESIIKILIPQSKIQMVDGNNGKNSIVEASLPPFKMTRFEDYLRTIKRKEHVIS